MSWRKFSDSRCRKLAGTLQNVDLVGVGIDVVQAAGNDETLQDADMMCADLCAPQKLDQNLISLLIRDWSEIIPCS